MLATTAVILARGLGSRMRREDRAAVVDADQEQAASTGLKGMIPDRNGRPFLDHILSALADGGVTRVIMVVAPDATAIRDYYAEHATRRVSLEWAIQQEPRGTADAVLAAEPLLGDDPFLVLNADNLYPAAAIRALVTLGEPGLIAFDRDALVEGGNIDRERIRAFALLEVDAHGYLKSLVEKPGDETGLASSWVSMNLWRFDAAILEACRTVTPSIRGELELPAAVTTLLAGGGSLRAVTMHAGVLDLSHRADIAAVASRLATRVPQP